MELKTKNYYLVKQFATLMYSAIIQAETEREAEEIADNISRDELMWEEDCTDYSEIELVPESELEDYGLPRF
jgi:hypothetical protein